MTLLNSFEIPRIPTQLSPESRVWIYQSDRQLDEHECLIIKAKLDGYTKDWKAHGKKIEGYATVLHNRFILILADETEHQVSGCSIDSSVRMLKEIESELKINLFDRQTLCFLKEEEIHPVSLYLIESSLQSGIITPETVYFNTTVQTKKEFEEKWLIPLKNSWLSRFIPS